jgi:hypothetical protein
MMNGEDSLEPNETEERVAFGLMRRLLSEALVDLRNRVDFLHACWVPKNPEEKAQRAWCLALGVLAHEIASASLNLIDVDNLRAAKVLGRSLMEYQLRLGIYKIDSAEAVRDVEQAPKELRKFLEGRPTESLAIFNLSAEAEESLATFMESNKGKPRSRNIADDIKKLNAGNSRQAEFEYLNLYGLPSALSHGSGLVFSDVILVDGGTSRLAWKSERLTRYLALAETTTRLIKILELIEETSGYFQANVVLWRKYAAILRPWAERFRSLVERRATG